MRTTPIRLIASLSFALLVTACGDDDAPPAGTDAGIDAGAMDVDAGPRDAARPPPDAGPPPTDIPWKGPWSLRVDTTHATVRWETRLALTPATIIVRPEAPATGPDRTVTGTSTAVDVTASFGVGSTIIATPDYPGTFYANEVAIDALTPGTCYTYEVSGYPAAAGRVCTMREPTDRTPIRFLLIGDTAVTAGHVGPIMTHVRTRAPLPDFTVHVGDIQYYSAIIETWHRWFVDAEPLVRVGAFMPAMGNHEYELDDDEFDQYTERFFGHPALDGDTDRYHFTTGGVHFFALNTQNNVAATSEQITWLTGALSAARASAGFRFSVIYFHKSTYTVGDADPRLDLRTSLEPLLVPNVVRLVLSGHMHGYERFEVGEVTYVTSAGGGGLIGDVDQNVATYPADAALRVASGGFFHAVLITIDDTTLSGEVIDDAGMVRDTFSHAVP